MKYDPVSLLLLVGYCLRVILLLAGLLGLIRYRELPPALRWLVGLIWFGLTIELASHISGTLYHANLWLLPIDAAGELWLLSMVFAKELQSPTFTRMRPWLAASFVLYAGLSIVPTFSVSRAAARFPPAVQVIESLMVLGMAALYFRKLLNELQVPSLTRDPMFWVAAGLVVYFLSKLLIALFSNYLLEHYSRELNLAVWSIHGVMTNVLYLCYLRALWLRPQK